MNCVLRPAVLRTVRDVHKKMDRTQCYVTDVMTPINLKAMHATPTHVRPVNGGMVQLAKIVQLFFPQQTAKHVMTLDAIAVIKLEPILISWITTLVVLNALLVRDLTQTMCA